MIRRALLVLAVIGAVVGGYLGVDEPLPMPRSQPREHGLAHEHLSALDAQAEADTRVLAQVAFGEDPQAVVAVTWVVLNRGGCEVAPLRCRVPIIEVVTRRRAFGTMLRGRFRPSWRPDGHAPVWVLAKVQDVLEGLAPDPTHGATHFHRLRTWTPTWAPEPETWRIRGSHAFYVAS